MTKIFDSVVQDTPLLVVGLKKQFFTAESHVGLIKNRITLTITYRVILEKKIRFRRSKIENSPFNKLKKYYYFLVWF